MPDTMSTNPVGLFVGVALVLITLARRRKAEKGIAAVHTALEDQPPSEQKQVPLILSDEQIKEFIENGVLVIPCVLSASEVDEARAGFHAQLKNGYGVDIADLASTADNLKQLSSTGGAGGILDIFYSDWKLRLAENPRVLSCFTSLWGLWTHKLGAEDHFRLDDIFVGSERGCFNPEHGYLYIDRVGFRVPDSVSLAKGKGKKAALQRSLAPHLDCCPHRMELTDGAASHKWRPVQGFIALTSTPSANQGGFEACLGLHKHFKSWARDRAPSQSPNPAETTAGRKPPCVGDFSPIRPKEDQDIISRMQHIACNAGDLVVWDYRIAHSNSRRNETDTAREVVYVGLLPAVAINKRYAQDQLQRYIVGDVPSDQWHEHEHRQHCSYEFGSLGRRLMAMDEWP
jgi:Protein of unknown function (DUF1479)